MEGKSGLDRLTKFPAIHTLRHLLTPGTPAYALIKLVAVGGVFGLLTMRGRSTCGRASEEAESGDEAATKAARPHPTSKKKRSRKRRRR